MTPVAALPLPGAALWTESHPADDGWVDVESLDEMDIDPMFTPYTREQSSLFSDPLYGSWEGPGAGRCFLATGDIGLHYKRGIPAVFPDGLLALDTEWPRQPDGTLIQRYVLWAIGKPPDVLVEVVSDRRGGEHHFKMNLYARLGVPYYVVYDPYEELDYGPLCGFRLANGGYLDFDPSWMPEVGLGMTLWTGTSRGTTATYLRWCDRQGRIIPTGQERADQERRRADEERRRAIAERRRANDADRRANEDRRVAREAQRQLEEERRRAEDERRRADNERRQAIASDERSRRLAEQLRALGIDPDA